VSTEVLRGGVRRAVIQARWIAIASAAYHAVTRRLVAACAVVGVRLETHLVLTTTGTYVGSGQVRSTGTRLAA